MEVCQKDFCHGAPRALDCRGIFDVSVMWSLCLLVRNRFSSQVMQPSFGLVDNVLRLRPGLIFLVFCQKQWWQLQLQLLQLLHLQFTLQLQKQLWPPEEGLFKSMSFVIYVSVLSVISVGPIILFNLKIKVLCSSCSNIVPGSH